jgi:hypothetical protein
METAHNHTDEKLKITGDWKIQSKNLKEKYASLNDADLKFEVGKESELIARLETKLNKKHDEVVNILKKGMSEKI